MALPDLNTKDLIIWDFDFAVSTFYEIDTDLVQPLLPKALSPMEVVPGISLINLTAFNFPAGGLEGELPAFQELIFSMIIAPDLSRSVPKFAMYILSLGSTSQAHLEHSREFYKLPVVEKLTGATLDYEMLFAEYRDAAGPILTVKNTSPALVFKPDERYFQVFTSVDDTIYVADVQISAMLHEHQQAGDFGTLHNHRFLKNIDMEDASPTGFLQMISKPGTSGKQYYPKPDVFRN